MMFEAEKQDADTLRINAVMNCVSVGYIIYGESDEGDGIWVSALWVHPEFRKQGIARELMELIEGLARACDFDYIRLRALPMKDMPLNSDELVRLYEGWGFVAVGRHYLMVKEIR